TTCNCFEQYPFGVGGGGSGGGGTVPGDYDPQHGGGGSGGGDNGVVNPPLEEDPCSQAAKLANNTSFKSKMTDLKSKTGLPNEVGYLMRVKPSGLIVYEPVAGLSGAGFIDLNPATPIDGYIHTHYTGLLPIFSLSDVRAIYNLAMNGKTVNPETFTAGVVTAQGTAYLMKIDNLLTFAQFANENLTSDVKFNSLEQYYNNWYNSYKYIYLKDEITAHELALLKSLENSGIITFKGNTNFNNWNAIKEENNTIINSNCN
ncbi:MAG: hypothetical protein WBP45_08120, partial [Daejeonella sp.]